MDQTEEKRSPRMVWIAVGAVVVFLLVLAGSIYLMLQPGTQKTADTGNTVNSAGQQVATQEQVTQHLDQFKSNLEQANKDQTAAKAALDDGKNRTKVGS